MTLPVEGTPNAIITDALLNAGLIEHGDVPDSEILARHSRRLRAMINTWQVEGIKLWLQVDQPITLIAGQTTYAFSPGGDVNITKPLRAKQGYYLDTTSPTAPVRRPIFPLSYNEWLTLSTTITQGPVSQYFVDKQQTQLIVSFWMTPDAVTAANGTAHLLIQTQITNFTNLTDTMNFPLEWTLALTWGLSAEISTGQPTEVVQLCQLNAQKYKTTLENWDVEDADVKFQPDTRYPNQGQSSFI